MTIVPNTPNPDDGFDYSPTGPLAPLYQRLGEGWPNYMMTPPRGWTSLILELDTRLSEIVPDYTLAQVKSKFAGLRYYIDSYGPDASVDAVAEADRLIDEAERKSYTICEECGEPGTLNTYHMWQETVCPAHARED